MFEHVLTLECLAVMHWGVRLLELFAKKEKIQFSAKFWDNLSYFAMIYDDYVNLHNPKVSRFLLLLSLV